MKKSSLAMITTFGLGHMRPFPGTWGSIPPVIVAGAGLALDGPRWSVDASLLVVMLVFAWACVRLGDRAEARFGKKDPSQVVADETAGQCLPLILLPAGTTATPIMAAFTLVLAFAAFRVFDILKIWPARQIQNVPGGWGILLDDLVAGVQAWIFMQVVAHAA